MNHFEEKIKEKLIGEINDDICNFVYECQRHGVRMADLPMAVNQKYGNCVQLRQNFDGLSWNVIITVFNMRFATSLSYYEIMDSYRYGRMPDPRVAPPPPGTPEDAFINEQLNRPFYHREQIWKEWNPQPKKSKAEEVMLPVELFRLD